MVDTRAEYDELFAVFWPISIVVFVLFTVLIVFAAVRYRSRSQELPEGRDDAPVGETVYALALAAIVVFLVATTYATMSDLGSDDPSAEPQAAAAAAAGPPLVVRVTASRWTWRFDYPDHGISQTGTPGHLPELVVPVGSVRFELTSLDVIHSLFVTSLRFKRDAFPGQVNAFTLGFARPGIERGGGQCAEYCGLRHSYMDFDVHVLTREEFDRWARTRPGAERRPA